MEKVAASDTTQNLRYERKFIYENKGPGDIIATQVLVNSFCFREIFARRTVNNIYYDDQAMSFYHQNVAGDEHRDKYRLRWYGDTFNQLDSPTVEIKKKIGAVGDKISFKLNGFTHNIDSNSTAYTHATIIHELSKNDFTELGLKLSQLSPSLYNSYERRYFLSHCEKFRITIDYNMAFYSPHFKNYKASLKEVHDTVLELKYSKEDDTDARQLSQELSVRLSKNSKYVRGVNLINNHKET